MLGNKTFKNIGALRQLKRVSKFSSKPSTYNDPYAYDAVASVSGPRGRALLESVSQDWHRPSGDVQLLEEGIMKYSEPSRKRCVDGDYLAILKKTLDELRPAERIVPLTLGAAAKHPDFPRTTSPGFPWVTQGYATKGDVLADKVASGRCHRAWDTIGRGANWSLPDSMAFHRVVASEREKVKVRPVWGYPTEVVLEEARYFLPLIAHLKSHSDSTDGFYGLGMETAKSGHRHLARNFEIEGVQYSMSGDFSNFDARVPSWLIRDIFSYISDWFDFSKVRDSDGKYWNVNVSQTCRRWKAMVSYFVSTKVRTPSGLRVQKSHGVPSGSMWTNVIDTIAGAVQMRTALYRTQGYLPHKDYYYGDDSQVFLDECPDLEALASVLDDVFGAILSPTKTILTTNPDNIHWLGYYHRDTGPERDLRFILASTIFPEREVHSPLESAARLLGQLYSCMHPVHAVVFYDAVQHILDKYNLTRGLLDEYVSQLPAKAMKFLVTVGLDIDEITTPPVECSAFGGRFISSVLPKPSARTFVRTRHRVLPEYAFAAEAYSNRALRTPNFFHDFSLFKQTFDVPYDEFLDDSGYFTD
ncbi:RNA-dependent RNA polymerase [Beauveria bassiana partitivirus 3]|nr:RNA-dependent RNA polymerase [Beauveria bassiana partitivirus 3]